MGDKKHRGRGKSGKKPMTIHLTEQEIEALDRLAETECRTRTGQALYLVLSAIRCREDAEKMAGAIQHPPARVRIPFGWTPIDYDGEVDE